MNLEKARHAGLYRFYGPREAACIAIHFETFHLLE
jgi:hypothetical protein